MKRKYKRQSGFITLPHINKKEIQNISKVIGKKATEEEARMFLRNRISPDYAALIDSINKEMARAINAQAAVVAGLIGKRLRPKRKKQTGSRQRRNTKRGKQ